MTKIQTKERTLCVSCNQELGKGGVIFDCPKCGKKKIARCLKCKKLAATYKCDCGFEGP